MEHTQQMKLKERQKFFEEAFQHDMEQYLSTGYLQIAERRGKWGRGLLAAGAACMCRDGVMLHPPGGPWEEAPQIRVVPQVCLVIVFASSYSPSFS